MFDLISLIVCRGIGYLIECKEDEEPTQLTPRKVIAGLKREFVVGAAASRVHTAVHTRTEVFTFGLNAGQLGKILGEVGE